MRRLLVISLVVSGCAGVPLAKDQLTDPGALLFNGYTNSQVDCYRCHNGDGTGASIKGPNLSGHVPKMTDEQIASTIQNGKSFMPAFKGKISDQEIAQIVAWLRQKWPQQQAPKS